MRERLNFSFPFHSVPASLKSLQVGNAAWSMHSSVPGASAFQMLNEPVAGIVRIPSVVATVVTEKDVDIVGVLCPLLHQGAT